MEFRDALRNLRTELSITQTELANALHVNITTISRWELGQTLPNRSTASVLLSYAKSRSASAGCLEDLSRAITVISKEKLRNSHSSLFAVEHESLRQLIEDAAYPIYVCDLKTDELLYANRKALSMIGEDAGNPVGQKCYACLMHRETPCPFCHKYELTEDGFRSFDALRPFDNTAYRVQGKKIRWNGRQAQVRCISDLRGGAPEIFAPETNGHASDTPSPAQQSDACIEKNSAAPHTDGRSAETADQHLHAIMNSINNGVSAAAVDASGNVQYLFVTDRFYEMLGYTREQYAAEVSDPFALIYREDADAVKREILSAQSVGDNKTLQYRLVRRDGRVIWIKAVVTVIQLSDADAPVQLSIFTDITPFMEAKEQLRVQKNEITELMNTTPGGIAVIELDPADIPGTLHTTYYNDSFFSYSGYDRAEYDALLKNDEFHFVFEEDRAALIELTGQICANEAGTSRDITLRCHTKDGGYRWLLLTGQLVARRKEICVIHIVLIDITERKLAEDKLRISEEMLRAAAEVDKRALILYDVKTNTCRVESRNLFSARYGETFSDIPASLLQRGIASPESAVDLMALFARIRSGEEKVRMSLQFHTGANEYQWFECNATTILNADGEPDHALLVLHNITEQRIKEAVYRKWQQSIEKRPPDSYTLFRCNLNKETMLDAQEGSLLPVHYGSELLSFDERTQKYVGQYVHADDRETYLSLMNVDTLLAMFYRNEHMATLEYREIEADGSIRWRLLTVEMVEYLNSNDVQAFLMYEDIDEKKRAELREKELAETDPLTGALNRAAFAELVEAKLKEEPGVQHAMLMMDLDGFKLLNDTFGHAAGDQALVDIAATLRSLVRDGDLVCRLGGDEFLIWLEDIPYNAVIRKRAQQMCSQVRKAFSLEVQLTASLGVAVYPRDGRDFDELYHKADKALYDVKQSGKNNFLFFSESEDARISPALENLPGEAGGAGAIQRPRRRMLIADSSEQSRAMLGGLFSEEYLIETAKNGTEAMIRLRHFGSSLSVVLLDLMMPGISGFEVLKRMRASTELSSIPVIVITGDEERRTHLKAIESGAADYVIKPVDTELIRIRVRSAVSKAENERLRAQNSYLQLQRDEELKYHTVLESTGTVVIEYNWRNHVFIYDNTISKYLAGTYDSRGLWQILLSDMVADSADVKTLQEMMIGLAGDRCRMNDRKLVLMKTPGGTKHWFRMNIYKQTDSYGLAEKMIVTFNDIHDEVLANEKLLFQATRDEVTGLYNRSGFLETTAGLIAAQEPGYYVIASVDIERFKVINDQYGTQKGDEVLCQFGRALQAQGEGLGAVCCRVMADNFAILYPKRLIGSKIMEQAHRKMKTLDGSLPPLRFSVGRCVVDDKSLDVSALYDRASMARNTIKGRYDTYIATYDESMRTDILRQQKIIGQMNAALEKGQFEVWFQPQYNHNDGSLSGAEALVRWRHPEDGVILPQAFIPVFERNGFIYEIDKYVWEQTCILLRKWLDAGRTPVPVSVNVSRYDVFREELVPFISGLVQKYRLPTELLCLEITESAFVESAEQIICVVRQLIELGFTVEIDDFGSGYSSLNTLKDVPAQVLKMDMRFLENDRNSQRGGNIIESVVRMAKWLGMAVIAEGVETQEQADYLRSIGCENVQGYLYAKPMPAEAYEALLDTEKTKPRCLGIQAVETWNNNAFWDPKSMESLVFNSYVGGASIFEYHNGVTEVLRRNQEYDRIFSGSFAYDFCSGRDSLAHLDEEGRRTLLANVQKAIDRKEASACEVCLTDAEGRRKYLRVTVRQLAQAGDRYLLYSVVVDITEQREAMRKERELSDQFKAIMANVHGGITAVVLHDKEHAEIIFSNDGFYALYGYTKEQMLAEVGNILDLILPEDRKKTMEHAERALRERRAVTYEYRCRKRDGSIMWTQITNSVVSITGIEEPVLLGVTSDITKLRSAEQKVMQTSDQLKAVLNHAGKGITALALYDGKPQYLIANDKYFEIIGYTREAYERKTADDMFALIHPDDREALRCRVLEANSSMGTLNAEYRVIRGDGRSIWVRTAISITTLAGIEAPVQIAVFSDITADKEVSGQLRFLNESAHEILAQPDSEQAINSTLERLITYFDADRGYVVEFDEEKGVANNTYEVCADGVTSKLARLQNMPFRPTDSWYETLLANRCVIIEDAEKLPDAEARLRSILRQQNIRSTAMTPLFRDGALIGFAGIDNLKQTVSQIGRLTALSDYIAILLTRRDLNLRLNGEQRMMTALMNDIPGGFVRMKLNAEGAFVPVYINNGFLNMVHMSREELHTVYGGNVLGGVHPEDRHIVEAAGRKMRTEGSVISERFRVRSGNGNYMWLVFSGRATNDYQGETYLNVYYTDVTGQVSEEEKQKELLDNLPCSAGIFDYDGKELVASYVNARYYATVGKVGDRYRSVIEAVHPDDYEKIKSLMSVRGEDRAEEKQYDIRIRHADGTYHPYRLNSRLIRRSGGKWSSCVTFLPIPENQMTMQQMMPFIFPTLMESSTDIAFAKDKDFRYLCCTRAYARILGQTDESAVVGKTDYELYDSKIADRVRAGDSKLVSEGTPVIDKITVIPSENGLPRYLRLSKYLLRDTVGNVLGVYGIGRDITERRETSDQLKLLTDTIPGGLATFACSPAGYSLAYYNDGFCALLGYTRQEMQMPMETLMKHILETDRPMVDAKVDALVHSGTAIDCIYRIRDKNGVLKWLSHKAIVANRMHDSVIINAVFLDVTAEQEEKERLRVSEELNRLAIEHSGNIITRFDVRKRTLTLPDSFNPIFELPQLLENMPEEQIALGRVSPETAHIYTELFESIVRGSAAGTATYQQNSAKGWRWLEAQYTTVFSDAGEPLSAVISFTDITEKLEKEIVYNKWQQSLAERPEDSYTLFRCNISRGASYDSREGTLLKIAFGDSGQTFDERTAEFMERCVYEEDREHYAAFMNADTLLAEYYRGHRSDKTEFREKLPDGTLRWRRLTVDLVEYPNSKDIEIYLMYEDIDKQKRSELLTLERAETDQLTGIYNRAAFIAKMEKTLKAAKPGEKHALMMLDVDNFKRVNDTLGHGAGDQALCDLSASIRAILRRGDLIGRMGGDEFFVFLRNVPDEAAAATKAAQICGLTIYAQGSDIPVTASIGIAMIPKDGADFDTLYKKVDAALYQEKKRGKKGFLFCGDAEERQNAD